jgi:hypothetical protein
MSRINDTRARAVADLEETPGGAGKSDGTCPLHRRLGLASTVTCFDLVPQYGV